MLLAEDTLETLVERLRSLGARDRRAILAHLSSTERTQLDGVMHEASAERDPPQPYSLDLAALLTDADHTGLTPAARDALRRASRTTISQAAPATRADPSLATVIGRRLRKLA